MEDLLILANLTTFIDILNSFKDIVDGLEDSLDKLSNGNRDDILLTYSLGNKHVLNMIERDINATGCPDMRYDVNEKFNINNGQLKFRFIFRDTIYYEDNSITEDCNYLRYKAILKSIFDEEIENEDYLDYINNE